MARADSANEYWVTSLLLFPVKNYSNKAPVPPLVTPPDSPIYSPNNAFLDYFTKKLCEENST